MKTQKPTHKRSTKKSQKTSLETRKTRSEMNRFIGKYMVNVQVEQGKGVQLEVVSNGNCLFASILYHHIRNCKGHLHNMELRQSAFDCINRMMSSSNGLSNDIEIDGLSRSEFDNVYMNERRDGAGREIYHYPDTLTISCMANQFDKHVVIFDDINRGIVTIIPSTNQMQLLDEVSSEAIEANEVNEVNYWVIRRESGNHYRPYVYKNINRQQVLVDDVIQILNNKIKLANSYVVSKVQEATGVKHYSIEWEEIKSIFETPSRSFSSIDKTHTKNGNKTKKKKNSNTNSKTRSNTSIERTNTMINTSIERANTIKPAREKRKIGHFPDVKYCWYGCDDHILVWLHDALIVFIETLGQL